MGGGGGRNEGITQSQIIYFSTDKLEQYKTDIETYKIRHKKSIKYEKDNKFDSRGYEK